MTAVTTTGAAGPANGGGGLANGTVGNGAAPGAETPAATPSRDVAGVLAVLRAEALAAAAQAQRPVSRVRVAAADVSIEIGWSEEPVVAERPARTVEPAPASAAPAQPEGSDAAAPPGHVVRAHTVGVFYHAPEPGAEPFTRPGDVVTAGQQVGIIEAMKLMIPVEADRGGRVLELLVPDATPVEHGQALLSLDPSGGSL